MSVNVDYLIEPLRLRIGDLNPAAYRYLDEWLITALIASVRSLARRWNSKYFISDYGAVERNTDFADFEFDESYGVIQEKDEQIIVINAAIIILQGSLENQSWNLGSWRDSEISYSNIETSRAKKDILDRLTNELDSYLRPPKNRLVGTSKVTFEID